MSALPEALVALAVRLLPEAQRERWAAEHRGELAAQQTPGDRLCYALGALVSAPALRRATTPLPLRCRLGVWHRWHTAHTDDGGRYVECATCGFAPATSWWGTNHLGR